MAGITGIYAFNQVGGFYMVNLAKAIDVMVSRGKDYRGSYLGQGLVALGQRQFKQETLSNFRFPYTDATGRWTVVADLGANFALNLLAEDFANKDEHPGEVILKLYQEYGKELFAKLSCSFAIAIYDDVENELILFRDPSGEKPLYYYADEDKFIFGSTLESILTYHIPFRVSNHRLLHFLDTGNFDNADSLVEGVHLIEPGSIVEMRKKQVIKVPPIVTNHFYTKEKITVLEFLNKLEPGLLKFQNTGLRFGILLDGSMASAMLWIKARSVFKNALPVILVSEKILDSENFVNKVLKYDAELLEVNLGKDELVQSAEELLTHGSDVSSDPLFIGYDVIFKKLKEKVDVLVLPDGGAIQTGEVDVLKIMSILEKNDFNTKLIKVFGNLAGNYLFRNRVSWREIFIYSEKRFSEILMQHGFMNVDLSKNIFIAEENSNIELQKPGEKVLEKMDLDNYTESVLFYWNKIFHIQRQQVIESCSVKHQLPVLLPFSKDLLTLFDNESFLQELKENGPLLKEILKYSISGYGGSSNALEKHINQSIISLIRQDELLKASYVEEQNLFRYGSIKTLLEKIGTEVSNVKACWRMLGFQHLYKKHHVINRNNH